MPWRYAAAVYSRDADLGAMKAPVISLSLDLTLREHARSSSVVIGVTLGSGFTLMVSFESLRGVYRLIEKGVAGFRRLPAWAQLSIAACVLAIVAHPKSRAKLGGIWSRARTVANNITPDVLAGVGEIAMQFFTAQQSAMQTYQKFNLPCPSLARDQQSSVREQSA
jgi:hypothetical protein